MRRGNHTIWMPVICLKLLSFKNFEVCGCEPFESRFPQVNQEIRPYGLTCQPAGASM